MKLHYLRTACVVLFSLALCPLRCYAADVVFIASSRLPPAEQRELDTSTQFYGLNLVFVVPGGDANDSALIKAVERETNVAVVIAANTLGSVREEVLLRAMNRRPGGSVPLLIAGVTPETDATLLKTWSGGVATGCSRVNGQRHLRYIIGRSEGVTQQLTNLELPWMGKNAAYLQVGANSRVQNIVQVTGDSRSFPIFIGTTLTHLRLFLECAMHSPGEAGGVPSAEDAVHAFAEIAPMMMFLKYSAGDRGWHSPHQYANLTIDDPWLREPYGYLSYRGLLGEMEKHNFFSTIAFIPWNYDRSKPEVVSLVRDHPDRFSICVHGDNHDHKEFTDYKDKPLVDQVAAMKQSLARMEKFQSLTGISYDKVMVYPHSMAPEKTMEALKAYNYLATVNSSNVPMDRPSPSDPLFALRPVTVSFGDFASVLRYSVAVPIPTELIAVNEFLGNPLFFYCHHDMFVDGIDAFDGIADQVNKLEPDARWRGVGEIAKHLYLLKLRDGSSYDVHAFSSNFCLSNTSSKVSAFHIEKEENDVPEIASVSVEGEHVQYQLQDGELKLETSVPPGRVRCVSIGYKNDLSLASVSSSKDSVRVYLLRMASDFRDITLSGTTPGRMLTRFYYKHALTPKQVLAGAFAFIVFGTLLIWRLWSMVGRFFRMPSPTKSAEASHP